MPEAAGPALLKQCSRPSTNPAESFWSPTPKQVWALESRLMIYFSGAKSELKLSDYYRQYVGVVVGGRKIIYGNFFRRASYDGFPFPLAKDYWRKEPVKACDGGPSYWGVVYDVEKGEVEPPVFNGRI